MLDLAEVEAQIDGAYDLSHLNVSIVRDLIAEVRDMRSCLKRIGRMTTPPHSGDLSQVIWKIVSEYYAVALPESLSDPERKVGA